MAKIAICVRNRLGVTKKCIEALIKHSKYRHKIYVFDNLTNYRLKEHFDYFYELFDNKIIQQYVVNSEESTYNAFSKAVALNHFGIMHEMDPNKHKYNFLVFLDNDIIVTPDWDERMRVVWKYIYKRNMTNIKVVGQLPGGIKFLKPINEKVLGMTIYTGKYGGSGLWSVRNNFFEDIGFLKIKDFVGKNKQHDQMYWKKLDTKTKGKEYILGVKTKFGIHVGSLAGSICNSLERQKRDIKFKEADKIIEQYPFDSFYSLISKNKEMVNGW